MRLLRAAIRPTACGLAVLVCAVSAIPAAAHPPAEPDYGIEPTTFYALWSGDVDDADRAALEALPDGPASEIRALALATDVPLDDPPAAVERWNSGSHGEFPRTDSDISIHPTGTVLTDGAFLKDAYAAVFAVQPSTRALVSPADRPLFVAPRGELLGTVDYRVELPPDSSGSSRSVDWRLLDHEIAETRVLVDGEVVTVGPGTHTPRLDYEAADIGIARTLTLEADVEATAEVEITTCGEFNNSTCVDWDTSIERRRDAVTVRESVEVVPYELSVTGAWGRYPDGDLGLVLYRNQPWLGYSMPRGDVRGVWRFYSARDDRWDRLIVSTSDGSRGRHSPMHPLQVFAYPFEPGPTASPRDAVVIVETYGREVEPAALPAAVHLDVIESPYTASYGIVTRTEGATEADWAVHAHGLVRGSRIDVTRERLREVPIHESRLELAVLESTAESVTIGVSLTHAETAEPIETLGRRGYVVLDGQRVETDASGSATVTVPRPMGGLSARFEPGPWWPETVGYVGDSDVVYVRGTVLHALRVVYEVGVPLALFLFGVFVIDRITGWRAWPPWRRL